MLARIFLLLLIFVAVLLTISISTTAADNNFSDKSPLQTANLTICTAAAMKSGQGDDLYHHWISALDARYKVMFPKMSIKEREVHVIHRVLEKRRLLNRQGISSTPAFQKFYTENCGPYSP